MVLCNKVLPRLLTNKVGGGDVMECYGVSSDMCVGMGLFLKKLGFGSLILASKPVTGFENSIQACN